VSTSTLIAALSEVLPPDRLLHGEAARKAFESDALTAFSSRPEAIVLAEDADDVVATVRACHRHGVPFVPRGSGTSLSGGSLPVAGGIVIALNRMNRILRLDAQEQIAIVQPGVINAAISAAAAPHGLLYAPDPSSQSVCTIGGNVAFNSGGAHCLKHGMTSNHVLAATVVLPDGEVVTLGNEAGDPCGPDWLGLFVGSEGLFGIVVDVTVRLLTRAEATRTILAAYPSLQDAGDAVSEVIASGLLPVAMEILDRLTIEAAEAAVGPGYPPAEALLLIEVEGERDLVEAEFAALCAVIDASAATAVRHVVGDDERALVWKGRKSAFSAVGWLSTDYIVQDGVVPRSRLGEALAEIERLAASYGLRVANVFHAGDGNLHPLILFDGRVRGALEQAEALAGDILRMCIALGGSITGEHGIGMEKRAYLPLMYDDADIALMRELRAAVDPAELSNRGKMLLPIGEPA
jgi:glycolate oxidase